MRPAVAASLLSKQQKTVSLQMLRLVFYIGPTPSLDMSVDTLLYQTDTSERFFFLIFSYFFFTPFVLLFFGRNVD